MSTVISLDERAQPRIYSYERMEGHRSIVLQWCSPRLGNQSVSVDSFASRHQTIVLEQGADWEIVLELRPRRLTEVERVKLRNA